MSCVTLADNSHEISFLIFVENWEMSSAAVVIGALKLKGLKQQMCDEGTPNVSCEYSSDLINLRWEHATNKEAMS